MRHRASLVAAMEGLSRPALRIARELSLNSRSGLTVRFLSKKLELPEEEIEYLVDVNHHLFFLDLSKIKLVVEGPAVIKRVTEGLENRGDVDSLFRIVRGLEGPDFRILEEHIGSEQPLGKKQAAEVLLEQYYKRPDSVVEYVAARGFSETAREVFDLVWQSDDGVMPISQLRQAHGGAEFEVEQALWELFRGCALFEMFRYDPEDRLVRVAGILREIRQWRETRHHRESAPAKLRPSKGKPERVEARGTALSEQVARLVAAIAARPARLRGDGDLFREDLRRLNEVHADSDDPPLNTCLWMAAGAGWLAQVDNELRAGNLDDLLEKDRLARHRELFAWLCTQGSESRSRRMLAAALEADLQPGVWYPVTSFVRAAGQLLGKDETPVLRNAGGHWHYTSPSAAPNAERNLARSLEETFYWLGVADRAEAGGESLFRISELGARLVLNQPLKGLPEAGSAWTDEIVVQPNFDIVVPSQDVDPLLTVPLDQFAERQSTGRATVYHLNKTSYTKAVQEGHDGQAFLEFLMTHNRGGALPPNVLQSLEDWRGGMKRVRLRTLHVLEAEDPLVMADIMHRRRFGKFFGKIDPQRSVAYRNISKDELARALEKEGFVVQ